MNITCFHCEKKLFRKILFIKFFTCHHNNNNYNNHERYITTPTRLSSANQKTQDTDGPLFNFSFFRKIFIFFSFFANFFQFFISFFSFSFLFPYYLGFTDRKLDGIINFFFSFLSRASRNIGDM